MIPRSSPSQQEQQQQQRRRRGTTQGQLQLQLGVTSAVLALILLCHLPVAVNAGMTYILLRGTGSNCLSVDPLPGSIIDIRYHLPGKTEVDAFDCWSWLVEVKLCYIMLYRERNIKHQIAHSFHVFTYLFDIIDLKIKDDVIEGKILEEDLNTEGMDEAEAALLVRQREVAIKRVCSCCH